MSKETTYEVLSLKGDEWQTDTIYSDRDEAIEAARNLHGDPHIDGAKVISEVHDDKTGGSKETTIDAPSLRAYSPNSNRRRGVANEGRRGARRWDKQEK